MPLHLRQIKQFDCHYHEGPPIFHLKDKSILQVLFFSFVPILNEPLTSIKKQVKHIWCSLSLQLHSLTKTMICFWRLFQQTVNKEKVKKKEENKVSLQELFSQPVIYEEFRDIVLRVQQGKTLWYNHYNLESYLHIKNHSLDILDQCTSQEEEELAAGIATYEAIVDLYVGRFLKEHPEMNQECFLPSLRLVALTIALKFADDLAIEIIDFQEILAPSLSPAVHTAMERVFLREINWNVSITEIWVDPEPDIKYAFTIKDLFVVQQ